ncbi:MAG: Lrp/AsnC family transcriptional regulator [Nanoarchaeota archaeon]
MIDEKDSQFITYLRNNARINLTTVSRKTSIPISTLYDRLKIGEKGIITRHTSLLDFAKLGYGCHAQVILKVDRDCREKLKDYLLKMECVNSLAKINNGFDFLAEIIFANIKELEEFLEDLDNRFKVLTRQVYYIIEEITREHFMTRHMPIKSIDDKESAGDASEQQPL